MNIWDMAYSEWRAFAAEADAYIAQINNGG